MINECDLLVCLKHRNSFTFRPQGQRDLVGDLCVNVRGTSKCILVQLCEMD
jgi:hypothetical protein